LSLPVSIVSDRDCQQNWDSVGQRLFEPGDIKWAAYANPDPGWLVANGAAVSRIGYPDLFKKIGTTWGVGDGSTTFNLPALSGRMPMGAGTGSGLTARTLGQLLGCA
jgi:microcystin-dependent protein